ncbi:MAG TPA: HAD family phosphatase [Candidatus Saccharimonadales bacterium]|nr:HAD family phosphatase [Candidatus Saccharimonadales bacterium]
MVNTIIFDFDGVIVLSSKPRFDALQKSARRYGIEIEDSLFRDSIGRITVDFVKQYLPDLNGNTLEKILADYQVNYKDKIIDHTLPISFTNEFIRRYKGDSSLAIASTNNIETLETILRHLGLYQHFKLIVGREHVSRHKPHPEIYLHTAKKLGVEPSTCIVIEDSPIGVLAANSAGMQVYGLLNGTNTRADFDTVKVEGFFATLPDLEALLG